MSAPVRFPMPEPAGRPAPAELAALRQRMADAVRAGLWATQPAPAEREIGGVRVLHFAPGAPSRGAVLHFHGGGFRMGRPESLGPYARKLADLCRVDVFCPAYRLAPDNPFPAALNDAWNVAGGLMVQGAERLILSGDSAGGGLAASLCAVLAASGVSVAGLVLHSPWLDLTVSRPSYSANAATDPLFSREAAEAAAGLYLQGGGDARDPLVSPLFADAAGFPPVLLTVGRGEALADDSRGFHSRLVRAGRPVEFHEIADMEHVAVVRDLALAGAEEAFAATAGFVDRIGATASSAGLHPA